MRVAGTTRLVLAAVIASLASAAHAGSLNVRDGAGHWSFGGDPSDQAGDFLLQHFVDAAQLDPRFGRGGKVAMTLPAAADAPTSLRVDAARRPWVVVAGLAGVQPQPIVARFLADGSTDVRWGVQGRIQLAPGGFAVRPNDLLPLADGSVLVAGETTGDATPHAIVFHLLANGTLDRAFGRAGVWLRPGQDNAIATSLAAGPDGQAAVSVVLLSDAAKSEAWAMTAAPTLVRSEPLNSDAQPEAVRLDRVGDQWSFSLGGSITDPVPPASLTPAAAPVAAAAASDTGAGAGGFNPFTADAASAPAAATVDEGLPWTLIGALLAAIAVVVGALTLRRRGRTAPRPPQRR